MSTWCNLRRKIFTDSNQVITRKIFAPNFWARLDNTRVLWMAPKSSSIVQSCIDLLQSHTHTHIHTHTNKDDIKLINFLASGYRIPRKYSLPVKKCVQQIVQRYKFDISCTKLQSLQTVEVKKLGARFKPAVFGTTSALNYNEIEKT